MDFFHISIVTLLALAVLATFQYKNSNTASNSNVASANDIPSMLTAMKQSKQSQRFAILSFDSTDGEAVNLQYSFENGVIGLDWFLIAPGNITDKDEIIKFAENLGYVVIKKEAANKEQYLHIEGSRISNLGMRIINDFYKINPHTKLDLVIEGFEFATS